MSNLVVLAPCFYKDTQPIHWLVDSAKRRSIDLHLYGLGQPFHGWISTHVARLKYELKSLKAQRFLFTDAMDCFFLAGLSEIFANYVILGMPPLLISSELSGINAGGFMGERLWMIEALEKIEKMDGGDPQVRWRTFLKQSDKIANWKAEGLMVDNSSRIFQTTSDGAYMALVVRENRFYNLVTRRKPCILHCNGGYVSPETQRDEVIRPLWERVYGADKFGVRSTTA